MPMHTVQQGEHLTRIAHLHGFEDFRVIWNHPDNAALKAERRNPNVLFPGDLLFIPDKELREEDGATEQRHRFQVNRKPLRLRVVLRGVMGEPLRNLRAELHLESEKRLVTTDHEGRIDEAIPMDAEDARLVFQDPQVPFERVVRVKIGHLDPVTEVTGQIARLNNLGYGAGDPARRISSDEEQQQFRSAVEEFQCDHSLAVTGNCNEATQQKLLEIHGC